MLPNTSVTKNPFAQPSVPSTPDGVCAVIASCSGGTLPAGTPAIQSSQSLIQAACGAGPLVEYGAYILNNAGRTVLAMQPATASVAATYGAVATGGLGTGGVKQGTFTVAATTATFPLEHYMVRVVFLTPGTLGTTGITYQVSTDNGGTYGATQSLGSGLIIAIPNTGMSFTLAATGTGTIVLGDFFTCPTERALMSDSDMATALNTLGLSRQAFEGVLLDDQFGAASVGVVDTILAGWEARGMFVFFLMNTRFKTEPLPTGETEAAYATAMATALGSQTSERGCVGADGAHVASSITGWNLKRPTSLFVMSEAMGLAPNIGIDPAYVGNGPAPGAAISDGNAMPFDHDEDLYPDLDNLGFSTLRSFAPGGPQGCYITNANVISPNTSNIRFLQHLRVLNKACRIAWGMLNQFLSRGVSKVFNPQLQYSTILEADAQVIEGAITPVLESQLNGQVSTVNGQPGVALVLSRQDNADVIPYLCSAAVQVVGLAYIKGFRAVVAFTKQITAA